MTIEEIRAGETENVEYKVELPSKSIKYMKSVVAFSNGNGGRIVFGVADGTWEVVGISRDKLFETKDAITNAIADSCEPMIFPDIYFQDIGEKTVIVVDIEPGRRKPYYIKALGLKEGTFVRVSGTSRVAEGYKLQELVLEGNNESFDQMPAQGQSVTEEEISALCRQMQETALQNSKSEEERRNVKPVTRNTLISWGLLVEKGDTVVPTNGFCLLAGKEMPGILSKTQCGVFKGSTRAVFVDQKTYEGPLSRQIEEAYQFVLRAMRVGAKIDGIYREDTYELPLRTVREMICNAVCHRSYLEPACVQVAFYDNRLEVTSPGMLVGGVTLAKMREGYSKVRNKGIAAAFAYMKIIERWGSGIPRMYEDCKDYGLPEPDLIDLDGDFRVNLYRIPLEKIQTAEGMASRKELKIDDGVADTGIGEETDKVTDEVTNRVTDEVTDEVTGRVIDGVTGARTDEVTDEVSSIVKTDEAILEILRKNPYVTYQQIASEYGASRKTIAKHIGRLKAKGRIARVGTNKTGYWEII